MDIETFTTRWSEARGGAERANYQMFLSELCEALELPRPDPASPETATNDYVSERGGQRRESEGVASPLRIALYKRGCFILEAKQFRADQEARPPELIRNGTASERLGGELPRFSESPTPQTVANRCQHEGSEAKKCA